MSRQAQLPEVAWYLVQCKPRQDARALEHLERQGFPSFCPTMAVDNVKGGKVRRTEQPLFPGYLFVHLGATDNWVSLRSTRGVSRIVAFAGTPCPVDDAIVEHLRLRCAQLGADDLLLQPGERVQIRVGPFAEIEAIFLSMDGEERVMLLLSILNREQQVPVRLADLQRVADRRRADALIS